MTQPDEPFDLCCLLWAHPGQEEALHQYEDQVLALFPDHGIGLIERALGDGADGNPLEVHLYAVPSSAALDAYTNDPRRTALLPERDRIVARTETFQVSRSAR